MSATTTTSEPAGTVAGCLSVAEVARRLGVSRSTVWSELSKGSLPSLKVAGRRLVRVEDLARYVQARVR